MNLYKKYKEYSVRDMFLILEAYQENKNIVDKTQDLLLKALNKNSSQDEQIKELKETLALVNEWHIGVNDHGKNIYFPLSKVKQALK